ncbi:MAG: adenine deaminase [Kiritimatiellia bacterium]
MNRTPQEIAACIDIALHRRPADSVIKDVRIFDLATGELRQADIALCGERIAAVGVGYEGLTQIDGKGLTAVPGFVDAHCHIESSLVTPYEFERCVLPHGTTAAVCDPHELANVSGGDAIEFFLQSARRMLMRLSVHVPSCVPALPTEEAGAVLDCAALRPYSGTAGLSEFMNVPGVLEKNADVLAKLSLFSYRPIDGHAPLVSGNALTALCAAGIANDHESSSPEEALEKIRNGMTVFLRAGSVGRNLPALTSLLSLTLSGRVCLCTDDRDPLDIRNEGHIDAAIRTALHAGCDPLAVYRAASLTPARHYGWEFRGLIAPGWFADIVLLSNLSECTVERVICRGKIVDEACFDARLPEPSFAPFRNSLRCGHLEERDLHAPDRPERVIGVQDGCLITQDLPYDRSMKDLATVCLIARHGKSSRIGRALVQGFGMTGGAIASSVGHDSHNLCVVGTNETDSAVAANALIDCGGGFAVALNGALLATLPLPLGGLFSNQRHEAVADGLEALRVHVRRTGTTLTNPLIALSFLPLPVIPFARITLSGLVSLK